MSNEQRLSLWWWEGRQVATPAFSAAFMERLHPPLHKVLWWKAQGVPNRARWWLSQQFYAVARRLEP